MTRFWRNLFVKRCLRSTAIDISFAKLNELSDAAKVPVCDNPVDLFDNADVKYDSCNYKTVLNPDLEGLLYPVPDSSTNAVFLIHVQYLCKCPLDILNVHWTFSMSIGSIGHIKCPLDVFRVHWIHWTY